MRSIDIFGFALAVFIALATLIVEPWSKPWWIGIIAAGLILLIALVHILAGDDLLAWGPWLLIIVGPLIGIIWLYVAKPIQEELPGFGSYAVIRLYDSPEFRRRYVFDFVSSDGAKVALYLSASSRFTFSVTDVRGESYPLEVKVGADGIPIDDFVILFCEVGLTENSTRLRILVNEKEVARRDLNFPLSLGKMDWKPGSLGAPTIGQNQGGIFLLVEFGIWQKTFSRETIRKLTENVRQYVGVPLK